MVDNLKTELLVRVSQWDEHSLLRWMGYERVTNQTIARLRRVIDSPELGLADGDYDFRFGSVGFLRALGEAVELDGSMIERFIEQTQRRMAEERDTFKPYLWVETDFQRKGQPAFALGVTQHWRVVIFRDGFWREPGYQQLHEAREAAVQHYAWNEGQLGHWGPILRYWFYHDQKAAFVIAPDGEIEEHRDGLPGFPDSDSLDWQQLITGQDHEQ